MDEQKKSGSLITLVKDHPVRGWRSHWLLIVVTVLMYATDFGTKEMALRVLPMDRWVPVIGSWLRLQLLFNSGAAFSMGTSLTVVFAGLGLVALIVLVVIVAPRADGRLQNVVTGLLIAGVAGNLTDRIFRPDRFSGGTGAFHGSVIDWIGLKYFAVFNVADMCITAAAVIIVLWLLRSPARQPGQDTAEPSA